jgi:hypothetical protein
MSDGSLQRGSSFDESEKRIEDALDMGDLAQDMLANDEDCKMLHALVLGLGVFVHLDF